MEGRCVCGDRLPRNPAIIKGKPRCSECADELQLGIIGPPPRPMFGGGAAPPEDDMHPWQENAVRYMEGF